MSKTLKNCDTLPSVLILPLQFTKLTYPLPRWYAWVDDLYS